MQLGDCWFDEARGELTKSSSGDVWHLPRAELQVLRMLVQHPEQVVAKSDLRRGDESHDDLSDSSVARAIFMIRSFIGPGSELLIETVKGQGYVLRMPKIGPPGARPSSPYRLSGRFSSMPLWLLALMMLLAVCASAYYVYRIGEMSPTAPLRVQTLTQMDGQLVKLVLFAHSRSNNTLLLEKATLIGSALTQCRGSRWRDVFVSLSHDSRVLNLTMRGDYMGQAVVRNLKISDGREPRTFISQAWLEEVDICD
ncbi:transcriptional regulator [Shewanella sp.]|uniref:winged helix-turn-helix domain-containing protein n=1 Tax=Shewanella sp. TaxID=50422 RepID=UPI00356626AB